MLPKNFQWIILLWKSVREGGHGAVVAAIGVAFVYFFYTAAGETDLSTLQALTIAGSVAGISAGFLKAGRNLVKQLEEAGVNVSLIARFMSVTLCCVLMTGCATWNSTRHEEIRPVVLENPDGTVEYAEAKDTTIKRQVNLFGGKNKHGSSTLIEIKADGSSTFKDALKGEIDATDQTAMTQAIIQSMAAVFGEAFSAAMSTMGPQIAEGIQKAMENKSAPKPPTELNVGVNP